MKWKKIHLLMAGVLATAVLVIVFFTSGNKGEDPLLQNSNEEVIAHLTDKKEEDSSLEEQEDRINEEKEVIVVDVKGEVESPGVYELTSDNRVVDALKMAGGIKDTGDENHVNFAEKLRDEMVIFVPVQGEDTNVQLGLPPPSKEEQKISINYAEAAELQELPGIGPAKAESIVTYREENGLFTEVNDITKVSGIGEKSFEKLADKITID